MQLKRTALLAAALISSVSAFGASEPIVFTFALWGQSTPVNKVAFYMGFVSGIVSGAGAPRRPDGLVPIFETNS